MAVRRGYPAQTPRPGGTRRIARSTPPTTPVCTERRRCGCRRARDAVAAALTAVAAATGRLFGARGDHVLVLLHVLGVRYQLRPPGAARQRRHLGRLHAGRGGQRHGRLHVPRPPRVHHGGDQGTVLCLPVRMRALCILAERLRAAQGPRAASAVSRPRLPPFTPPTPAPSQAFFKNTAGVKEAYTLVVDNTVALLIISVAVFVAFQFRSNTLAVSQVRSRHRRCRRLEQPAHPPPWFLRLDSASRWRRSRQWAP